MFRVLQITHCHCKTYQNQVISNDTDLKSLIATIPKNQPHAHFYTWKRKDQISSDRSRRAYHGKGQGISTLDLAGRAQSRGGKEGWTRLRKRHEYH